MSEPLRILHLEDDAADARLIRDSLAAEGLSVSITLAQDRAAFLTMLNREHFDLILADYRIPGFDGLEALKLARQVRPEAPFLFVTGAMGEQQAVDSLKSGAVDYILKENLARLGPAVQRTLEEQEQLAGRHRAEAALQQRTKELLATNARLEAEIVERRRIQESLQHLSEELVRSNQDLEQFAYVASHDLQEPLRAVSGYLKLLCRRFPEKTDPKATEYIQGALDGAARMERLIQDLLALSRVGTRGAAFAPSDLNAVLEQALRGLRTSLRQTGAKVTQDRLPTLVVDSTQILQLFQNLIGNSLKFRAKGKPVIHVGAQPQPERWVFSVRDNGIGIAPQHFERIFHVFQRLHTRQQYPGTGIGLAICKRIAERHGGAIWVESALDQGSTFFFSLPMNPAKVSVTPC